MADTQSRSHRFRANGIAALVRAGTAAIPCQLEELSADGAFLRAARSVPVGTVLEVDLKRGAGKSLHLRAVVLRQIPGRGGQQIGLDVEFRLVAPADLQRLISWLDEMKGGPDAEPIPIVVEAPITAPVPVQTSPIATAPIGGRVEDDRSKLMLQIKGLFREMDELRNRLRERETEVDDLRRRLSTAEQLLGSRRARK